MKIKPALLTILLFTLCISLPHHVRSNEPIEINSVRQRPNVVLVITDDQGYGDLSCHGNPILKTPNIDELYQQSIRLTDYHVAPTCSPTRAALQSGHWTNRTGVWHTIMGRSMLREDEPTFGQVFSAAGYATGMFGKWHLGDNYPYRPEDRGYTEVLRHGGGGVGQTPDYWDNAYFDGSYWHNGTPVPANGYCTDVFFDYATRFIKNSVAENKPFFAYISTNAPHGPLHSPPESAAPYLKQVDEKTANFFGMIANIDDNVGRLRKFLSEEGLTDNTIFIFTTDNGTASGQAVFNAGMRGRKGSQFDGGHRVPFFVSWPAKQLNSGTDVDMLSHAVDILPTLIDFCDVPAPEGIRFDGTSIRSLIEGTPDPDVDWKNRILVTDSQRVKDPIMWKSSSVMTSKWRLINGDELYDMQTDPGQKQDVSSAYPHEVRRLREFYQEWWEELKPTFAKDTAIFLGHPKENPARLTSHDWITTKSTPWNQAHIRKGIDEPANTGFWNVMVFEDAEYEFRLRRWPEESDVAINEGLPPGDDVPGLKAFRTTAGRQFDVNRATIQIGDQELSTDFAADAKEAVFKVKLKAGKTKLTTKFHKDREYSVGAYYVYVTKLK